MIMLMNAPILLGIIAVVFGVLPILIRSNVVLILLALCAGEVLARLMGNDVTQIVNSFVATDVPMYSIVQIVLLVVLPLLIVFWYKKAVKLHYMALHIIPAIATVLLCFMFVVAKLPYDMQNTMQNSNVYLTVKPYFGLVMAAAMATSAVWLFLKKPKRHKPDDEKKHK